MYSRFAYKIHYFHRNILINIINKCNNNDEYLKMMICSKKNNLGAQKYFKKLNPQYCFSFSVILKIKKIMQNSMTTSK